MRLDRLTSLVFCTLFALGTANTGRAEDTLQSACFDRDQTSDLELRFSALLVTADELTQMVVNDDSVPRRDLYKLTLGSFMFYRMQQHLWQYGETFCESALNRLHRDFGFLRQTYAAFAKGNPELEIARLESPRAQELLARIDSELAQLAGPIGQVKVRTKTPR